MTDQQDKQALSDAELEAVVGGAGLSSITGTQSISDLNLGSMDIETAMMNIQGERAKLLDDQLRQQVAGVQAKNEEIGQLNNELSLLKAFSTQIPENGSIPIDEAKDALSALGSKYAESQLLDGNQDGFINREEVGALIDNLKTGIDSLGNSQQMDMLRLQNLSNKRNEAFEMMTNFIKKMQDSRSSIIGNMR